MYNYKSQTKGLRSTGVNRLVFITGFGERGPRAYRVQKMGAMSKLLGGS